mgnify:CR=1 FL=1
MLHMFPSDRTSRLTHRYTSFLDLKNIMSSSQGMSATGQYDHILPVVQQSRCEAAYNHLLASNRCFGFLQFRRTPFLSPPVDPSQAGVCQTVVRSLGQAIAPLPYPSSQ